MNRPYRASPLFHPLTARPSWCCWAGVIALAASLAHAQPTAPPFVPTSPVIPVSIITSAAPSPAELAGIKAYTAAWVGLMTANGAGAPGISVVRHNLVASSNAPPPNGPSAAFCLAYFTELNNNFKPLLNNSSADVRLNVAITIAKVTGNANPKNGTNVGNAALVPCILEQLKDKDDAVCLWAMKAAGNVIGPAFTGPNNPLVNAVTASAAAHQFKGCIVDEAYQALDPSSQGIPAAVQGVAQPVLIAQLLNLYGQRVALYSKGIPDSPTAEKWPSLYLTKGATWPLLKDPQKVQAMQLMLNLIAFATGQAQATGLGIDQKLELTYAVNQTAGGIVVVGQAVGDANLSAAAQAMVRAIAIQFPAMLPALVSSVHGAFNGVTAPPAPVVPAVPAPAAPQVSGAP